MADGRVGSFPNMRELSRRVVFGEKNPLDISTIVSIYPRVIKFFNLTLTPGRWTLPAGSIEKPALLTIGSSSWLRDVGPDEPMIEIPQSSIQVAESLVKDYLNGMFACDMHSAVPGLFFIPGRIDEAELRGKYNHLLQHYLNTQLQYYRSLIKFADSLWARSNGNPLTINDEMRLAAKTLGSQDKDWMKDHHNQGMVRCFACGAFKHPDYVICQQCHTPDPDHPNAAKFRLAQAEYKTAPTPAGIGDPPRITASVFKKEKE
jgi:hypothetical protein